MVTTIGIDPHKATHTAVAINETETVLGELTIPADRSQTKTLLDWAQNLDGDGRVWAVEAAGGLGYLLSQQLVASGEHVVDVSPVLASRVRLLGSGRSNKNDPNDARSVAIAALRQPGLAVVRPEDHTQVLVDTGETSPRAHRSENPGGMPAPFGVSPAATRRFAATTVSDQGPSDAPEYEKPRPHW